MNQPPTVLIVLGALAVIGALAAFTSGRRAAKRAAKGVREVHRLTGMLLRTLVIALVITGIEWLVVTHATDQRVIAATLAGPALLAGYQVARLFAVTEVVYSARRGGGRR